MPYKIYQNAVAEQDDSKKKTENGIRNLSNFQETQR